MEPPCRSTSVSCALMPPAGCWYWAAAGSPRRFWKTAWRRSMNSSNKATLWERVTHCKIHPGIGIARVGNSTEGYLLGPEVPYPVPAPPGGYKDSQGALKRQAARFRIYGYDESGEVVDEITAADAAIAWTVHVANSQA